MSKNVKQEGKNGENTGKKYRYFVAFITSGESMLDIGVGNVQVTAEKPIANSDDIAQIEKDLAKINKVQTVTIANWKRFEDE